MCTSGRNKNITLDRIYNQREIDISISILLCTKNVHVYFGSDIYQQNDGAAMGSLLGPVLAGIFMIEFDTSIIPTVMDNISHWRRYVDDVFVFIKKGYVEHFFLIGIHSMQG